jgi:hypothetical protein
LLPTFLILPANASVMLSTWHEEDHHSGNHHVDSVQRSF